MEQDVDSANNIQQLETMLKSTKTVNSILIARISAPKTPSEDRQCGKEARIWYRGACRLVDDSRSFTAAQRRGSIKSGRVRGEEIQQGSCSSKTQGCCPGKVATWGKESCKTTYQRAFQGVNSGKYCHCGFRNRARHEGGHQRPPSGTLISVKCCRDLHTWCRALKKSLQACACKISRLTSKYRWRPTISHTVAFRPQILGSHN